MNWHEAKSIINDSVRVGTDLNTVKSNYRFVKAIEDRGFIIPIGKSNEIKIPWSMLEQCFQALISFNGYDGDYFRKFYPVQAASHPCHIHVIGQIFVASGLAYMENRRYIPKK